MNSSRRYIGQVMVREIIFEVCCSGREWMRNFSEGIGSVMACGMIASCC